MDVWGDHAVQCLGASSFGSRWRHEQLQRVLLSLFRLAGASASANRRLPTAFPPHPGLEPGDICLQTWGSAGADLYIDLFVVSPWHASSPPSPSFQVGHAVTEHARYKRELYSSALEAQLERVEFLPFGMDIFGGILPDVRPLLRRVQRCLAGVLCPADIQLCVELSVVQCISYCVARAVGMQLAAHLPLPYSDRTDPLYVPHA